VASNQNTIPSPVRSPLFEAGGTAVDDFEQPAMAGDLNVMRASRNNLLQRTEAR